MPRSRRADFEGAYHHVMARGNRGEDVFPSDLDRLDFLDYLGIVCERHGWRIYAYCLMSNHYHLLVHTPQAGLSEGMKALNGYYTKRLNWRYDSYGHVFQGRYKSLLIEDDTYLLEVIRYISMNPVDAGLVRSPGDWPWSSYSLQSGKRQPSKKMSWLEIGKVHGLVSSARSKGGAALREFVLARSQAALKSRQTLRELMELTPKEARELRAKRILQHHRSGLGQSEIADLLGVNQSTVQRVVSSSVVER